MLEIDVLGFRSGVLSGSPLPLPRLFVSMPGLPTTPVAWQGVPHFSSNFRITDVEQVKPTTFILVQYYAASHLNISAVAQARCETHIKGDAVTRELVRYAREWCDQSRCCDSYLCVTQGGSSLLGLPPSFAKVQTVLTVLVTWMRPVVFLDLDALILPSDWCPQWPAGKSFMIAPDAFSDALHTGYKETWNTGFYVVNSDTVGRHIMTSWWDYYVKNASACWMQGGHCHACRAPGVWSKRGRRGEGFERIYPASDLCYGVGCLWGGECDDQGAFNDAVLPAHSS